MVEDTHWLVRWTGRLLFLSRWLLAPLYLGLAGGLVLILVTFAVKFASLIVNAGTAGSEATIIGVLSLIDFTLLANLVLIVMLSGYKTFVSQLDLQGHPDTPQWIGHIDFADLKLKLMASIVAISAIQLLEDFLHLDVLPNRELAWHVGIHITFVVSALLLALTDRVSSPPAAH